MKSNRLEKVTSEAEKHHLVGNTLCLDFANTLYGHSGTPLHEYLFGYRDLVVWSRRAGILTEEDAERLIRVAERHPSEALSIFHRAIALRETLFRIFSAIARGISPKQADVVALNTARSAALVHSQIERTRGQFVLDWDDKTALDRMLWLIAVSATELLTSEKVKRVRECAGQTCDWLFVDTSRNQMRRWCSMRECGNRAKARRFLERKRKRAKR
jgi:predicted RNA-binding Zn ribbon-like protein